MKLTFLYVKILWITINFDAFNYAEEDMARVLLNFHLYQTQKMTAQATLYYPIPIPHNITTIEC